MTNSLSSNISLMYDSSLGFDIVLVCTSNTEMENYWQSRLEQARGSIMPKETIVVVVTEDWEGGAGNGLGTLYAYQKAVAKGKTFNYDIDKLIKEGASAALFHTAGKGTRLAPLPGSEINNKPGVKLPGLVSLQARSATITILEAVIRQTGVYGASRPGRLSVFWGDQVFVPSVPVSYVPTHHADILCMLGDMPSAEEWKSRGLSSFGLIAVNNVGDAAQVEKVTHETATSLLNDLGQIKSVGTSLGSFSTSFELLTALLNEFSAELAAKKGKMDTDPHWWMPLTLSRSGYISLLARKNIVAETSGAHWDRMKAFKSKFLASATSSSLKKNGLLGAVDVGSKPFWWDYGQLHKYKSNNSKLVGTSEESEAMKRFFRVNDEAGKSTLGKDVSVQDGSILISSNIKQGSFKSSVVVNSTVGIAEVEDCILVNVTAKKVHGKGCVLYNVVDDSEDGLHLENGTVLCDVAQPEKNDLERMRSKVSLDAGKMWKDKVEGNAFSFEEVYNYNQAVSLVEAESIRTKKRKAVEASLL